MPKITETIDRLQGEWNKDELMRGTDAMAENDTDSRSITEVLDAAEASFKEAALEPQAPASPFVYRTATTDAARELISKRDMLRALVSEDNGELDWLEQCNAREVEAQAARYAEARSMVEARRNDRQKAADAFAAVIDGLQENRA